MPAQEPFDRTASLDESHEHRPDAFDAADCQLAAYAHEHKPLVSRDLRDGDQLVWRDEPKPVTIRGRKSDDSGWWLAEGGGLADVAVERGDWRLL